MLDSVLNNILPGYAFGYFVDDEDRYESHYYLINEVTCEDFQFHNVEFLYLLSRQEQRGEIQKFGKCLRGDPVQCYRLVQAAIKTGYDIDRDGWFARWLYELICEALKERGDPQDESSE